ncbi:hypothetical protein MRX96_044624 [Rhipicephalus microplus]
MTRSLLWERMVAATGLRMQRTRSPQLVSSKCLRGFSRNGKRLRRDCVRKLKRSTEKWRHPCVILFMQCHSFDFAAPSRRPSKNFNFHARALILTHNLFPHSLTAVRMSGNVVH